MFYAQLRGNTQGLVKLTTGALAKSADASAPMVEKEGPVGALINGGGEDCGCGGVAGACD